MLLLRARITLAFWSVPPGICPFDWWQDEIVEQYLAARATGMAEGYAAIRTMATHWIRDILMQKGAYFGNWEFCVKDEVSVNSFRRGRMK
jgi:hypothetical protein